VALAPPIRRPRTFSGPKVRSRKLVSVLMAAYQAQEWVVAAAASVLDQALPAGWDLELLVCVDGCTATLKAVQGLHDPRVGVAALDKNYGTYIATNTILGMSRGELVTCMGADDIMLPTRLLKLVGAMERHPEVGLAGAWYTRTDEDLNFLEHRNTCGDGTWVHRRSILVGKLGGFMPWTCGADSEVVVRTSYLGAKRHQVREHLYLHRQHPKQLTADPKTAAGSKVREGYVEIIERARTRYKGGARPQRIVPVKGKVASLGGFLRKTKEAPPKAELKEVSMASIPARRKTLKEAVESLLPQVDRVNVYLNEYRDVPSFLNHPKIRVARSQKHGNRGDAGKFFWSGRGRGYHLTADDDIIYPKGYVTRLVNAIDHYGRRAVLSFHGTVLRPGAKVYYKDRVTTFRCLDGVDGNHPVHVAGTGVMGYHSDALKVTPEDFKHPNMADVWMGLLCQKARVPCVVLQHKGGWLKSHWIPDTIFRKSADHLDGSFMDSSVQQNRAIQSVSWDLLPAPAFRIGVVMPIWRREPVARAALRHLHRLRVALQKEGVSLRVVIVGSEKEVSASLVREAGRGEFRYVEWPNSPLGSKFQAGVDAVRKWGVDAAVINGSDDFLSLSVFKHYVARHYDGAPLMGVKDATLLDTASGKAAYWAGYTRNRARIGEPAGTGRFYSARTLDSLGWELYPTHLSMGLDAACMKRLGARKFELVGQPTAHLVALKTADALNAFPGGGAVVSSEGALTNLFPGTQEDIRRLLGGPRAGA